MSDFSAAARQPAAGPSGASIQPGSTARPCPRCGGSGQLRTGHGYRSCLECAARGFLDRHS